MLNNIIQWFSSFGLSEWIGIAGIVATVIVAITFRSRASRVNQKSKGSNSPNINANRDVTYHHDEK